MPFIKLITRLANLCFMFNLTTRNNHSSYFRFKLIRVALVWVFSSFVIIIIIAIRLRELIKFRSLALREKEQTNEYATIHNVQCTSICMNVRTYVNHFLRFINRIIHHIPCYVNREIVLFSKMPKSIFHFLHAFNDPRRLYAYQRFGISIFRSSIRGALDFSF